MDSSTRLRRDGCESGLVPHHELDTLANHTTTIALFGVPGPRAIGKKPTFHLWGASLLPSYVSLHYLESLAILRLLHLYSRTVLHSHIENLAGQ